MYNILEAIELCSQLQKIQVFISLFPMIITASKKGISCLPFPKFAPGGTNLCNVLAIRVLLVVVLVGFSQRQEYS